MTFGNDFLGGRVRWTSLDFVAFDGDDAFDDHVFGFVGRPVGREKERNGMVSVLEFPLQYHR